MKSKIPKWFIAVVVIAMLPMLAWPTLLSRCSEDSPIKLFVWLLPAYVIASGICALLCYSERREVAWILIVLMLLTQSALIYAI